MQTETMTEDQLRAALLEAFKAGMTEAAEICKRHPDYADITASNYIEAIETARDALTEAAMKPL